MSKVKIKGNASGTGVLTIEAPNTNTDRTITLPDSTGNILMSDGDGSSLTGIEGVPSGIISMWSGAAAAIPSGWNLCDGNNGTPNLVGKFIKSASTAGGTGGSNTHSHSHTLSAGSHTLSTSEMPSHNHSTKITGFAYGTSGSGGSKTTQSHLYGEATNHSTTTGTAGGSSSHSHSLSGSIADGSNEPAYFELCYIMKS